MASHNNKDKIIKSLKEHTVDNGYIDINKLIYEMHGVLSDEASVKANKPNKDL